MVNSLVLQMTWPCLRFLHLCCGSHTGASQRVQTASLPIPDSSGTMGCACSHGPSSRAAFLQLEPAEELTFNKAYSKQYAQALHIYYLPNPKRCDKPIPQEPLVSILVLCPLRANVPALLLTVTCCYCGILSSLLTFGRAVSLKNLLSAILAYRIYLSLRFSTVIFSLCQGILQCFIE